MKYLGLDLGSRTLGIAISTSGIYASNLKVIRHNEEYDKLINEVKQIVDEYKIDVIVLGLPKNMNNSIGEKGNLSISFKEKLEKATLKEVVLEDERLTTVIANNSLIKTDNSRKKRKEIVDSVAATIILQSYLDRINK
jgi:putative Holliday junction resolvase